MRSGRRIAFLSNAFVRLICAVTLPGLSARVHRTTLDEVTSAAVTPYLKPLTRADALGARTARRARRASVSATGRVGMPANLPEGRDHLPHRIEPAERGPQQRALEQALAALGELRAHLVGGAGQRDRTEHVVGHLVRGRGEVACKPCRPDAVGLLVPAVQAENRAIGP